MSLQRLLKVASSFEYQLRSIAAGGQSISIRAIQDALNQLHGKYEFLPYNSALQYLNDPKDNAVKEDQKTKETLAGIKNFFTFFGYAKQPGMLDQEQKWLADPGYRAQLYSLILDRFRSGPRTRSPETGEWVLEPRASGEAAKGTAGSQPHPSAQAVYTGRFNQLISLIKLTAGALYFMEPRVYRQIVETLPQSNVKARGRLRKVIGQMNEYLQAHRGEIEAQARTTSAMSGKQIVQYVTENIEKMKQLLSTLGSPPELTGAPMSDAKARQLAAELEKIRKRTSL